ALRASVALRASALGAFVPLRASAIRAVPLGAFVPLGATALRAARAAAVDCYAARRNTLLEHFHLEIQVSHRLSPPLQDLASRRGNPRGWQHKNQEMRALLVADRPAPVQLPQVAR